MAWGVRGELRRQKRLEPRTERWRLLRFKDLVASEGALDSWYAFEAKSTATALRKWCVENEIEVDADENESA
jgi:hypothetical protein